MACVVIHARYLGVLLVMWHLVQNAPRVPIPTKQRLWRGSVCAITKDTS
jgi:hypothetical protein